MDNKSEWSFVNYKTAVQFMPADPAGIDDLADVALPDELILAMDERENIARGLAEGEPYLSSLQNEIEETDRQFLNKRQALLALVPWYSKMRQGKNFPKLHWWWYLDEIPPRQCSQCQLEMSVEPMNLTISHNNALAVSGGLLVYVCPKCGASGILLLSIEGMAELVASLLTGSRFEVEHVVECAGEKVTTL